MARYVANEAEGVTKISRGVYTLAKNEETSAAQGLDPDNLETQEIEITRQKARQRLMRKISTSLLPNGLKGRQHS
jgi:hypothetical protein